MLIATLKMQLAMIFNGRVTFNGKNYDLSGFNNPNEAEATHIM